MTGPCPVCGEAAVNTVGPVYSGSKGLLWRRRYFEEKLYRCGEGHVYAVRVEGDAISIDPYESVEEWVERKLGVKAPERPPGL
jgi:hypothetical protein